MKNYLFFFFFSLFLITVSLHSKENTTLSSELTPPMNFLLQNSSLGTEFWVAMPMNEDPRASIGEEGQDIIITSIKDTKVTVEVPGLGFSRSKNVEAFKPTIFASDDGETSYTWVVTESETATNKGVHIFSDEPISVYVITVKTYSSEGYLAIPVDKWGSEYFNCSYYDDHENNRDRGGGFIVLAAENGTNVNIMLNGEGFGVAQTAGGHDIGDEFSVSLRKGQTYMVVGDGTTFGQFDLSGSKITSSKPVGVVTFHTRTPMPSNPAERLYRDNLVEMLTPVQAWGKRFVSVQFSRNQSGSRQGEGDNFRVVASEAGTKVTCQFFDMADNSILGNQDMTISKEGGLFEPLSIKTIDHNNNKLKSVRGVSVWNADKPVQLCQYAWSFQWDGDRNWDPLQVLITPVEQFTANIIFQTPSDHFGFDFNEMSIFAIGDPSDPESTLLKSIKYDGQPLHTIDPKILSNNIPGTDIYWSKLFVETGVHYIESDTRVGGYVSGYKVFYSYGWPLSMGLNKIDEYDRLPPEISVDGICGEYTVTITEQRNGGSNPDQKDQGLAKIVMLENESNNYKMEFENPDPIDSRYQVQSRKVLFSPIDLSQPGFVKFAALDRAGNLAIDSLNFVPDSIEISSEMLDYGSISLGKSKTMEFEIRNIGTEPVHVDEVSLKDAEYFSILTEISQEGFGLSPGEDKTIEVEYMRSGEYTGENDYDTLYVDGQCSNFMISLNGFSIVPRIASEDWVFDEIEVGDEICIKDVNGLGLRIDNPGDDTLRVYSVKGFSAPFFLTDPDPSLPFKVLPGEEVYFNSICFFPEDSGSFSNEITISSNAYAGDSVFTLSGSAYELEDTMGIIAGSPENRLFSVSPNPVFGDKLRINFLSDGMNSSSFDVFTLSGRKVWSTTRQIYPEGKHSISLPAGQYLPGMYYIRFSSGAKNLFRSFLILR